MPAEAPVAAAGVRAGQLTVTGARSVTLGGRGLLHGSVLTERHVTENERGAGRSLYRPVTRSVSSHSYRYGKVERRHCLKRLILDIGYGLEKNSYGLWPGSSGRPDDLTTKGGQAAGAGLVRFDAVAMFGQ